MDALRVELVQQLEHKLRHDQDCLARYSSYKQQQEIHRQHDASSSASVNDGDGPRDDDSDPFLDADLEIVHELERATGGANSGDDEPTIKRKTTHNKNAKLH